MAADTFDLQLPDGTLLTGIPAGTKPQDIATRFGLTMPAVVAETPAQSQTPPMQPSIGSQVATEYVGAGFGLPTAIMATGFAPLVGQPSALDLIQDPNRVAEARSQIKKQAELPPLSAGRLFATTLAGASDPTNLALPGGTLLNKIVTGGAAATGGDIGAETGGFWGGLLGGVSAGLASNTAMNTVPKAITTLIDSVRGSKKVVEDVATAAGGARAARAAETAKNANPNLAANLLRADEIKALTGVDLPILAASGGDTTLESLTRQQIAGAENTAFTEALKLQQKTAEAATRTGIEALTAKPSILKKTILERGKLAVEGDKQIANLTAAKREQGVENITNRIQDYATRYQTGAGKEEIGTALTNLLDAKESAIRDRLSPEYDKVLGQAKSAGLNLNKENATALVDFVTDERNLDVFSKFPSLYSQIKQQFNPNRLEATGFVNIDNVDSLKRNANKAIRQTKDSDQLRLLGELKRNVDTAIESIDPDFATAYKAIDARYATELGLPFSEKGIVDINRAKFVEDTVPRLTKNTSSLKQAMAIIGDDPKGMQIINDAFMYDIGQNKSIINTTTGEINPKQLNRYLADHKEQMDLVPGLRDRILADATNVQKLVDNRSRIYDAEKATKQKRAESLYETAYGTKEGINGVVKNRLQNPQQFEQLWDTVKGDFVAREGVKMAMLDNALETSANKVQFFKDNQPAFEMAFGKGTVPKIEALLDAAERLKEFPVAGRINVGSARKTPFEQALGSSPVQIAAEVRNPILSSFRVVGNILSRFTQNQATKIESQEIQKFLLDRNALNQTMDVLAELEKHGFSDKAAKLGKNLLKNAAFNSAFGGVVGGRQGLGQTQEERVKDEFDEGINF